jgi:hypothetical protein
MENMPGRPTAAAASAALTDAEASRDTVAGGLVLPSWFLASLGAAIAVQIGTTAVGLGDAEPWLVVLGLGVFAVAAAVQLARFRRLNGIWLGGLASRVVLGTGMAASAAYALALGAAIWAAYAAQWGLTAACAVAGGTAYAASGARWLAAYRAEPAAHSRGESAITLALLAVAGLAGLALLVLNR